MEILYVHGVAEQALGINFIEATVLWDLHQGSGKHTTVSRDDTLTGPEEHAEYATAVAAIEFISVLQAKARRLLSRTPA